MQRRANSACLVNQVEWQFTWAGERMPGWTPGSFRWLPSVQCPSLKQMARDVGAAQGFFFSHMAEMPIRCLFSPVTALDSLVVPGETFTSDRKV